MSDVDVDRAAIVAAVARVLDGARAEDVVPSTLMSLPHLDNAGRARVARAIYAVCVLRLRLAFLAHVDARPEHAARLLQCLDDEDTMAVWSTWDGWPPPGRDKIVVERSCPRPIVDALCDSLGDDGADAFLKHSNVPARAVLRTNTLRATRDALEERLLRDDGIATRASASTRTALVVEGHANLFGSKAWRDGWFEVQDASSQLCVEACGAKTGDVVVDLCAGRGGKTLALAAAMEDRGTLYVHDVDTRALADMTPRLKRAGVTCVRPLQLDLSGHTRAPPVEADVVLVDAPCTSLGVLRRSPDLRFALDVDAALRDLVPLQRRLLDDGAHLVRPGGRLVYATCSVLRAENDDVVAAFVRGHPSCAVQWTRTLLPHNDGCDGFFIAVIAV